MAERIHGRGRNSSVEDRKLLNALSILIGEIAELADERPGLAAAVHTVASHLAEKTAPAGDSSLPAEPTAKPVEAEPGLAGEFGGRPPTRVRMARSPQLASPAPAPDSRPAMSRASAGPATNENAKPRYSDVTDDDLSLMVERCRLKAEGTLWALEREERLRDGADFHEEIRPNDHEIIRRAKQIPNCYLWMNQPRDDIWSNAGDFDIIADCFDALGESLAALDQLLDTGTPEQFLQAINLTAEAQSALRTAVSRVESYPDSDQQMAYHWLRNRAGQDRFYIARFMKISDPAEPNRAEAIIAEAQALQKTLVEAPSKSEPPQEHRDVA